MDGQPLTVEELQRILSNPFYAINIHPSHCEEHKPLVTEEMWIQAGVQSIKEGGAEKYLRNLLENLKGNYVS